jgi:uncharacterized linocin/CFP29 family protein
MDNLHRELAPVSEAAWAQIEEEATRTFKRHLAGRRVVDVHGPEGYELSAVGTGRVRDIDAPAAGVLARQRLAASLVELRAAFTLDREEIDDVERGAQDSNWQPVKDAAKQIAFAEDRAIFDGYPAAGINGIRPGSSNPPVSLPQDVREYPAAVARALGQLRESGVDGPYCVLLSADAYIAVSETSDHGYPVLEHIRRLVSGEIIWAPAISGAVALTTRGGDFSLRLGQEASIGYLSHTATEVQLYLQETLTFLTFTAEASVSLPATA